MSRNAQSNLKVRIDKISSNQVNVDGFYAFGEFSQIRQSEISLADLTILTSFRHFRFCIHFWTYLENVTKKKKTIGKGHVHLLGTGTREGTALYIYI